MEYNMSGAYEQWFPQIDGDGDRYDESLMTTIRGFFYGKEYHIFSDFLSVYLNLHIPILILKYLNFP